MTGQIQIIGYRENRISDTEWDVHYEVLYSCTEEENIDANSILWRYKDFGDSHWERSIPRKCLIEILTEPNKCFPPLHEYTPYIVKRTKEPLKYIKDYEDFLIREVSNEQE